MSTYYFSVVKGSQFLVESHIFCVTVFSVHKEVWDNVLNGCVGSEDKDYESYACKRKPLLLFAAVQGLV